MTTSQIEKLFYQTINSQQRYGNALQNILEGVTENQLYNWRKMRTKPTIGDMLNVLYQLGYLKIKATGKKQLKSEIDFSKKGINLITGYLI